jgi:hypothetical protein
MSTAIQVRWERGSKKRENCQITTGTAISVRSYSLKRDYREPQANGISVFGKIPVSETSVIPNDLCFGKPERPVICCANGTRDDKRYPWMRAIFDDEDHQ